MKSLLQKISSSITHRSEISKHQFITFGIFGFISYPLYYLIWLFAWPSGYENLPLRIIASLICLPLILKNSWPNYAKIYLPLYWYLLLIYCLPFFFTFMLFKNNFSTVWLLNTMSALVWAVLLTDALSLCIIFMIGIPIGIFGYYLTTEHLYIPENGIGVFITFLSVFVFSAIFSKNKEKFYDEKLNIMRSLGASIAHELRTPLRVISSGVNGIKKYLPDLIKSYQMSSDNNLSIPYISPIHYQSLVTVCNDIEHETNAAFTFIDMLLVKVNHLNNEPSNFEVCSINSCISEAIQRYPFDSHEINKIHWQFDADFYIKADKILIIHVIFNLIKNALYSINSANKGNIFIWCVASPDKNLLYFKDEGTGIMAKDIPFVFDQFYTKTKHGTGIGLAFCKYIMQALNGDIICSSIEGEYTSFKLIFPKVI